MDDELEYYARRAREERAREAEATNRVAKSAHAELAQRYEAVNEVPNSSDLADQG